MARRPSNASNDMYNSGNYPEHYSAVPTLRPRRNSAQSLQQRSGDYSSSQSSVSSLGTRMSRRGSSGAPGGQFTPLDQQNSVGTPPFSVTHGGHAAVAKHYVDPIMESPPFKLGVMNSMAFLFASASSGLNWGFFALKKTCLIDKEYFSFSCFLQLL